MTHDNLSYFLAHLNLAAKQKRFEILVPNTKLIRKVLLIILSLGYIYSFSCINSKKIKVFLKYNEQGQTAIRQILRVSRPGARVYISCKELAINCARLNNLNNTYQTLVVSTPKGLFSHNVAIKKKVGGEILLVIN